MHHHRLLFALLLTAAAPAQARWTLIDPAPSRRGSAMEFDPRLQRVLLFGGWSGGNATLQDQWLWDGANWSQGQPPQVPPSRGDAGIAYDTGRQRLLVFGGNSGTGTLNDTWEWNGVTWTLAFPGGASSSPLTRGNPALAYDAARARTVLFENDRTYEWDGTTWILRTTATVPPNRYGGAMAWHAPSGRVVLFGGVGAALFADTWTWDGSNWRLETPPQSPPARSWAGMTYDSGRARVILSGGRSSTNGSTTPHSDVWQWDGSNWLPLPSAQQLPPREGARLAFDAARARLVQFGGGINPFDVRGDLWEHDGTTWTQVQAANVLPPGTFSRAVFDTARARTFLQLQTGASWEHDGNRWLEVAPGPGPGVRQNFAMAYDRARSRTVLFGGHGPGFPVPFFNDTWEWDGATWTQRQPATVPAGRAVHAMAYDLARARTVMFGGATSNDTWEWDGSNWQQVLTTTAPPAGSFSMAHDLRRQRMVLFAGQTNGETWEYDGSAWTQRQVSSGPGYRNAYGIAWDPLRDRVVMVSGTFSGSVYYSEVWEWDGTSWQQQTGPVPPGRGSPAVVFDEARGSLMQWGGHQSPLQLRETWRCVNDRPATFVPFGSGCPGSAGVPVLGSVSGRLPWIGDVFGLEVQNVASGALATLAFGLDNVSWGGNPLPVSLAPKMPGCSAWVNVIVCLDLRASGNTRWDFPILVGPALVGMQLHCQGLVLDNAVPNPLRAAVSNAATVTLGVR